MERVAFVVGATDEPQLIICTGGAHFGVRNSDGEIFRGDVADFELQIKAALAGKNVLDDAEFNAAELFTTVKHARRREETRRTRAAMADFDDLGTNEVLGDAMEELAEAEDILSLARRAYHGVLDMLADAVASRDRIRELEEEVRVRAERESVFMLLLSSERNLFSYLRHINELPSHEEYTNLWLSEMRDRHGDRADRFVEQTEESNLVLRDVLSKPSFVAWLQVQGVQIPNPGPTRSWYEETVASFIDHQERLVGERRSGPPVPGHATDEVYKGTPPGTVPVTPPGEDAGADSGARREPMPPDGSSPGHRPPAEAVSAS